MFGNASAMAAREDRVEMVGVSIKEGRNRVPLVNGIDWRV